MFDSSYFCSETHFEGDSLALPLNHINSKLQVKFNGICLKQEKTTFTHKAWLVLNFL